METLNLNSTPKNHPLKKYIKNNFKNWKLANTIANIEVENNIIKKAFLYRENSLKTLNLENLNITLNSAEKNRIKKQSKKAKVKKDEYHEFLMNYDSINHFEGE